MAGLKASANESFLASRLWFWMEVLSEVWLN